MAQSAKHEEKQKDEIKMQKEIKTKKEKKVNEPKQKRSIETRNKILEVGSMLMLQKGYHNVTTDDVAQAPTVDFEVFLNSLFDFLMDYHKKFWIIHEELESLYHSDAEIAATIDDYWQKTYRAITEIYVQKSGKPEHAAEKVRIALDLIEDYCHACMHPIVETLDQDYLRQSVISLVKNLLT